MLPKSIILLNVFFILFSILKSEENLHTHSKPIHIKKDFSMLNVATDRDSAVDFFWTIFESGNYQQIDNCILSLKAHYLKDPKDAELALLIAHAHFWKVTERFRLKEEVSPNITDNLIIAERYFNEAKDLNPKDDRIDGWLSGVQMSLATIHDNRKEARKAYFKGKKSIRNYPSFNHFSIAYLFSNSPYNEKLFQKAIDSFYKSVYIATHNLIDKNDINYEDFLYIEKEETNERLKRAVWNGPKAKHNLEGFFLIMGDFLVKAGKTEEALTAYKNATLTSSFDHWPFKDKLLNRIMNIEANVENFRQTSQQIKKDSAYINSLAFSPDKSMMFNSYTCTVCHQAY